MFLIRWLRSLASLPILWIGQLLLNFNAAPAVPLLKTAWAVSGDTETGRLALTAVARLESTSKAYDLALAWLREYPNGVFAGAAGLMAVELGHLDDAQQLLQRGHELGSDRFGTLEWLEFLIAERTNTGVEVAQRLEKRSDLPPDLSCAVRIELMFDALMHGRFDEAQRRAEAMLDIADDPRAEAVLWALALRAGDAAAIKLHDARIDLPPAHKCYYQFLGSLAVGAKVEAEKALNALRNYDAALAERAVAEIRRRESAHVVDDAALPAGPAAGDHGA